MADAVISTERLTKRYGQQRGISDLTLKVRAGEVFGFLGPNGAGKTTTIRVLLDFIRSTSGAASIFGLDVRRHSVTIRRRVGYLPGDLGLYERMTGHDLLTYFAHLRGGVDPGYVRILAERFAVDLSRPIRTLSRGNKQKVGLVQALMHQPELLILDEPTSGLDPLMQHEFQAMMREIAAEGRTVFLSSHALAEVELIADRVGIVRAGELAVVQQVDALKERALRRLEIQFAQPVPPEVFRAVPGMRDVIVQGNILRCTVGGSVDAVIKTAARYEIENITSHEPDLEEIFLAYFNHGARDAA